MGRHARTASVFTPASLCLLAHAHQDTLFSCQRRTTGQTGQRRGTPHLSRRATGSRHTRPVAPQPHVLLDRAGAVRGRVRSPTRGPCVLHDGSQDFFLFVQDGPDVLPCQDDTLEAIDEDAVEIAASGPEARGQ